MRFSMSEIQELTRHLRCISRNQFNTIMFGCSSDHMWSKLKENGIAEFIMYLDSHNLDALEIYFSEYLEEFKND